MKKLIQILAIVLAFMAIPTSVIAIEQPHPATHKQSIAWRNDVKLAAVEAYQNKKVLFVFFYMDGCGWCAKMKSEVFSNEKVISTMNAKFVAASININSGEGLEFEIKAAPTIVAIGIDPDQKVRILGNHVGYMNVIDTLKFMDSVTK